VTPEIEAALATDGTIDITTVGARTGLPRRGELWFLQLEGRPFITGTPGPRNWYSNLLVHPRFTFHLKESLETDIEAVATPVLDAELRRWVFEQPHPWNDWYRGQASIDELVEGAPMVEVTFGDTTRS
jgi:hypothetical protein